MLICHIISLSITCYSRKYGMGFVEIHTNHKMGKKNKPSLGKSIIRQRVKSSGNIKHANSWVSLFYGMNQALELSDFVSKKIKYLGRFKLNMIITVNNHQRLCKMRCKDDGQRFTLNKTQLHTEIRRIEPVNVYRLVSKTRKSLSEDILNRSRKHSLKFSFCHPDKDIAVSSLKSQEFGIYQ